VEFYLFFFAKGKAGQERHNNAFKGDMPIIFFRNPLTPWIDIAKNRRTNHRHMIYQPHKKTGTATHYR